MNFKIFYIFNEEKYLIFRIIKADFKKENLLKLLYLKFDKLSN